MKETSCPINTSNQNRLMCDGCGEIIKHKKKELILEKDEEVDINHSLGHS